MRPLRILFPVLLLAALSAASSLAAQKEPRRPKLPAGADTNNAHVYYQFALQTMKEDPEKAADALYWTTRLDPNFAEGFYARRVALLISNPTLAVKYWSNDRRTMESDEVRRIDSLFYHALTLNPFVSQLLERQIHETSMDYLARKFSRDGSVLETEVRYAIDREVSTWGPIVKAELAYGDGRFGDALELYASAINADKRNGPLHLKRGQIFYQMGTIDSAVAELNVGLEDLRKRDKKDLIYVYQSKALTEHSIGLALLRLGHVDAAREAFGRALQEDLAYSPAHFELAYIALDKKDTATALAEMDLAVQVRSDDPAARYIYGYNLTAAGKFAEAEPHLRKAVELDRWFALPHYVLGFISERKENVADAAKEYTTFLALAPVTDGRRAAAKERLETLNALLKPN